MQRALAVSGAGLLAVLASGCVSVDVLRPAGRVVGSGRVAVETRPAPGVDAVEVGGAARLIIERSGRQTLTITAEDNILPYLTAEIHRGRLVLGVAPHVSLSPHREIVYRLSVHALRELVVSGAAEAEAWGVATDELRVAVSGAARARLSGWAEYQDASVSGASRYEALDLESRVVWIDVSGSGTAGVYATELLDARVTGAALLRYLGWPEVRLAVSGAGAVEWIGPR